MGLSVPPAVNYPSPLVAVPIRFREPPREGDRAIVCEVTWGTMGGPSFCVNFNLQNNTYLEFSQIVALSVDNSACGADVQFIFPDTADTLTIPAFSPKSIVEVFTNQTQFYLLAIGPVPGDITRFTILNSLPPPVAVPTSQEQNSAVVNNIPANAVTTTTLVPATVNGTVESISVGYQGASGTGGSGVFEIRDGANRLIAGGQVGNAGSNLNATPLNLADIRVRFTGGLVFKITTAEPQAGSAYFVNLYYRTP